MPQPSVPGPETPGASHKLFPAAPLSCLSPLHTHSSSWPKSWVLRVLPLLDLQPANCPSRASAPSVSREAQKSPSAGSSPTLSPPSQPLSPAGRACWLPFLTLSSSLPAEAVVTTDINAVVVAALSSQRPELGPLNPTRRPPRLR